MNDLEGAEDEAAGEPEPAREPEPVAPPTVYQLLLVRDAGDVVARCAGQIAKKFPRFVGKNRVMTHGDLLAIGHEALYRAARAYEEKENPDFAAFARYYVRGAMLDAIDDLFFEERVTWTGLKVGDNFCAFHRHDDYDVMRHDEAEARRRYRAFANGVLAATFAATLEQAGQCLDVAELEVRRDYEQALVILRAALARLAEADRQILALMYRDLRNLKDASAALGIPYGTARARHARALKLLHEQLVEQGITRAPRPLVLPEAGGLLDARAPPTNDTDARDSG